MLYKENTFDVNETVMQPSQVIPNWIAERIANTLWGQKAKITVPGEFQKWLDEKMARERWSDMFYFLEEKTSLVGQWACTMDVVGGEPKIATGRVYIANYTYGELANAVIQKEIIYGSTNYITVEESWNKNSVKRRLLRNGVPIGVGLQSDIMTQEGISETWEHNLGFVPVVIFHNGRNWAKRAEPDTIRAGRWLKQFDKFMDTKDWELDQGKTQVLVTTTQKNASDPMYANRIYENMRKHVVVNINSIGRNIGGDNQDFQIKQAQYNVSLKPLDDSAYVCLDTIMNLSGYKESGFNNVGTVQQNETEIGVENRTEALTVQMKQSLREENIKSILCMIAKMSNKYLGKGFSEDINEYEVALAPKLAQESALESIAGKMDPNKKEGDDNGKNKE